MKLASLSLVLCLVACQKTDPRIAERLDNIEKRLTAIERRPAANPAALAAQQPRRPDPNVVYNIPVGKDDVIHGPTHAKVTIVEGFDFACPFCAQARPTVIEAAAKFPADVRVVSK